MSLIESNQPGAWPKVVFPDGPKAAARRILAETAAKHGEKVSDVIGDRRFKPLVMCRREVAWRIAKETNLSFVQIGVLLRKDHSSIIGAIQRQNDATGTNVRGQGGLPPDRLAMNRASAARHRAPMTPEQKRRRARLHADAYRYRKLHR